MGRYSSKVVLLNRHLLLVLRVLIDHIHVYGASLCVGSSLVGQSKNTILHRIGFLAISGTDTPRAWLLVDIELRSER